MVEVIERRRDQGLEGALSAEEFIDSLDEEGD